LITQVAGRAGRADASGRVVVQTTTPALPVLRHALEHDYESFAAEELQARQRVGLPPFRRLARIILAHTREETVRHEAEEVYNSVTESIAGLSLSYADVLGPAPCMLSRLRGKYRYDLLVRTHSASDMRELLRSTDESGGLRTKAESLVIDVDPVALT
jgi:primosomal protein N' (replication factor Y)